MVQMLHTVFLSLGSLSKYVRYGKCDFELFGWLFLSHLLTRLSSLVHQTVAVQSYARAEGSQAGGPRREHSAEQATVGSGS